MRALIPLLPSLTYACLGCSLDSSLFSSLGVMRTSETKVHSVTVDDLDLFYREAGDPSNPTILRLHGYPSSSHQFRHLIPILAAKYHVLAPDYPGFGFTSVRPHAIVTISSIILPRQPQLFYLSSELSHISGTFSTMAPQSDSGSPFSTPLPSKP